MKFRRTRLISVFVFLAGLFGLSVLSSRAEITFFWSASATGPALPGLTRFQEQKRHFFVQGKVYAYDYQFINNEECLKCHADRINSKEFAESAHGPNSCNSCHWEIEKVDIHVREMEAKGANPEPTPVNCTRCHEKQAIAFVRSVHSQNGFSCTDCHSAIHKLPPAKIDQKLIYQTCTNCHDGSTYKTSVHGAAALAGNPDVPGCTDCHGIDRSLHDVRAPKGEESKRFHTDACAGCHADKKKMERNKVDPLATKTYYEGIHGEIEELGYPNLVAGCSDCHGAHDVLPSKDPKSTLSKNSRVKTCSKCHREANPRFAQYIPHLNYQSPRRPVFFWAYMFMHGLLISVFGFFWIHTFLFWRKDFWLSWRRKAKGPDITETAGMAFRRFSLFDRILHFMMLISFMGLVLSGLPLAFPGAPWAARLISLFGGFPTRGIIHRIFACIMTAAFASAVVYIIYFLFFKKIPGRPGFWKRLFGPDSLFPRVKDFRDLWSMLKWFIEKGPRPEFDRWTYWEKFDFFAVFWGMMIIGTSGVIRWVPELFTKFLPGWIVNVAVILHSDEALLAVGFIFTVHFFNNHLRPRNFPLNTVIFSGKLPHYQLIEDHGLFFRRLLQSNQLTAHEGKYPGVWVDLFSRLLAFLMLGIGALCLILIGWKFLQ
jgi:cytochrome b subunit of formate dehydrogenase